MSFGKKAVEGLIWGQIGMSGRTLITFMVSIIAARALGVENYGVYAVLMSLVELLIKVADMGVYALLNTYIPRLLHSNRPGECSFLVRGTLLFRNLLILAAAGLFVRFSAPFIEWMGVPDIGQYMNVVVLLFLARGFMDGFVVVVTARVDMRYYSAVEIGASVFQLLGALFLVERGIDVGGLMELMILVYGVQCLMYGFRSLPVLKPRPAAIPLSEIWKFCFNSWVGTVLQYLRFKSVDVLMLMYFLQDKKAVAYYEVAYLLVMYGGYFLSTALDRLAAPLLSQARTRFGLEGMRETWMFLTKISIFLMVPVFVFLIAHGQGIVNVFYSESFAPAGPLILLFSIFSLAGVCLGSGTSYEILFPLNKEKIFVALSAVNGLLNFGSALILIPLMGVSGVVIATGGSALVTDLIALTVAQRAMQAKFPFVFARLILLMTSVGISWTLLLGDMNVLKLIFAAAGYAVIVIGLTLRFHRFNRYEKETLRSFSPRAFDRLLGYGLLR